MTEIDGSAPAGPISMNCGNCCNAVKHPHEVGRILCMALPPHIIMRPPAPGFRHVMAQNAYPELDADKLGCTVLWNVSAATLHNIHNALMGDQSGARVVRGGEEGGNHGEETGRKAGGSETGN